MKYLRSFSVLFAAIWAGGCMMQNQSAPQEMGPSSYGWALTITATPDVLPRDGSSQSIIRLNYRDGVTNQPLAQRRIVVATSTGTLSAGEVVTDAGGNASITFTAPSVNTPAITASVTALPVGDNIDNSVAQFVRVGLLGPEVPTAAFTFNPAAPSVGSAVTFDASTSSLAGSACGALCSYTWDFGDGSSATGMLVQHTFTGAGVQNVTLTVTAPGGTTSSVTRSFTMVAPTAPVAAFTVTPSAPVATQQAIFNASTSSVGTGATITQYAWDFGDSTTATSSLPMTPKTYGAAGTYIVTLTITDSLARTATVTQTVTVN
jgi:PKD repeat protein